VKEKYTQLLKNEAIRLGFMSCGIAEACRLNEDAIRLENWLKKGYQSSMQYMERNFDARLDPSLLVPGAKSVITLLFNYAPSEVQSVDAPKIAKYAWGIDYHFVIKDKLLELLGFIAENIGAVNGRGFVDSAPVLERSWAVKSGLGWVGKNGNLLTRNNGSFFFIATLITDLELMYDDPFQTNHCGSCAKCMDACPTEAIVSPTVINANKCISYLTIELKDALIPAKFHNQMSGWMFGCDICQDVCPWNRFSKPNSEPAFVPIPEVLNLSLAEWESIGEENFNKIFKKSPLKRAKWKGIQKNIGAIKISS